MHRITGSGSDRGSARKNMTATTSVVVEEKGKNLDLKNENDSISIKINDIDDNNNYKNIGKDNNNNKCLDCIAVAPEGKEHSIKKKCNFKLNFLFLFFLFSLSSPNFTVVCFFTSYLISYLFFCFLLYFSFFYLIFSKIVS